MTAASATRPALKIGDDELVHAAEIARRLGVSRERIRQLSYSDGFPQRLGVMASLRIWRWSDIEEWARRTGRLPRPPARS
jgi:hypothetical protein